MSEPHPTDSTADAEGLEVSKIDSTARFPNNPDKSSIACGQPGSNESIFCISNNEFINSMPSRVMLHELKTGDVATILVATGGIGYGDGSSKEQPWESSCKSATQFLETLKRSPYGVKRIIFDDVMECTFDVDHTTDRTLYNQRGPLIALTKAATDVCSEHPEIEFIIRSTQSSPHYNMKTLPARFAWSSASEKRPTPLEQRGYTTLSPDVKYDHPFHLEYTFDVTGDTASKDPSDANDPSNVFGFLRRRTGELYNLMKLTDHDSEAVIRLVVNAGKSDEIDENTVASPGALEETLPRPEQLLAIEDDLRKAMEDGIPAAEKQGSNHKISLVLGGEHAALKSYTVATSEE